MTQIQHPTIDRMTDDDIEVFLLDLAKPMYRTSFMKRLHRNHLRRQFEELRGSFPRRYFAADVKVGEALLTQVEATGHCEIPVHKLVDIAAHRRVGVKVVFCDFEEMLDLYMPSRRFLEPERFDVARVRAKLREVRAVLNGRPAEEDAWPMSKSCPV